MEELLHWLALMGAGLLVTVQLTVLAGLLTIILAALAAVASISPSRILRILWQCYVDIFRSVPLLALLMFFYYVLGRFMTSVGLSSFTLAVIALALNEAAYLTDIYRGALRAVPERQWEAGQSIGLGWLAILLRIIVPQSLPPAIPATLNMVIALIKHSSLASLIAVNEVSMVATVLVSDTFRPLEVYSVLALMYLAIIVPLSLATGRLEIGVARLLGLADRRSSQACERR